jgi:hypothetical protein
MSRIEALPIRIENHADHDNTFPPAAFHSSLSNNLTQRLPLLVIFHQPPLSPHPIIDDIENSLEPTGSSFGLHKTSDGQSHFASMFEHNEELNTEADGFDVQCVLLVDSGGDRVRFARVLHVADAVTVPCPQKNDELLPSAASWDSEAQDLGRGFEMEESREPRPLWAC